MKVKPIGLGSLFILVAIILFVLAFFKVGPEGIWLIGLALWAAAGFVE